MPFHNNLYKTLKLIIIIVNVLKRKLFCIDFISPPADKKYAFFSDLPNWAISVRVEHWSIYTAQKTKFSIKETADLVTFTEEILNGKLYFLSSDKLMTLLLTHFRKMLHFFTLATPKNKRFSNVFTGYIEGTLDWNGLKRFQ